MPRAGARAAPVAALGLVLALVGPAGCRGEREAPRLYRDYCARCHGRDGGGIRDLPEAGLDLTASAMVARGSRGEIAERIARGKGKMPGFDHRLSPAEIERLVELVIALGGTDDGR
jgi:mono/diheme cytochrome c family protein